MSHEKTNGKIKNSNGKSAPSLQELFEKKESMGRRKREIEIEIEARHKIIYDVQREITEMDEEWNKVNRELEKVIEDYYTLDLQKMKTHKEMVDEMLQPVSIQEAIDRN